MSACLLAPLLLVALCLGWFAVQRTWLRVMGHPPEGDALDRPGGCGHRCVGRAGCPGRDRAATGISTEEHPR